MKNIMLVGNANTGKTTLLNSLTKSMEHTGNWHGVTVEEKKKYFKYQNQNFCVVDLPGIYSLNSFSLEEQITIDYIFKHNEDLIINTADINTLQKNMFLTLDLLSFNKNLILLINNMGRKTKNLDIQKIKNELNIEVFVLDFDSKKDIQNLKHFLYNYKPKNTNYNYIKKFYSQDSYNEINLYSNKFKINNNEIIKIIEKNNYFIKKNKKIINKLNIINKINFFNLSKEKYNYINSIIIFKNKVNYGQEILDKILLNKFLAILIFLCLMLGIFYLTFFSLGNFLSCVLSDLLQVKIGGLVCNFFENNCSIVWVNDLVKNGFFAGVGSLVSFLPQVVLLFIFLAIIEDSGYFSRLAFIFEDFFNDLGLSGKSIYTLLMGFGCSASAVLTARAMENKTAKIKTAILTPYMSCSAKLPIYAVLGGVFFGAGNVFVIFLLYLLGVFSALLVSIILDKFGLKSPTTPLMIEFPPYRFPKPKKIFSLAWLNLKVFLIKVTTIFISLTVIIWCLSSFSFSFEYIAQSGGKSMLQNLGEIFAPIFAPLGFNNWGAVGALIAGIVAKEIIVSSIAIFNGITANSINTTTQISTSITDKTSVVSFTTASALSYLTFCLLYCPCLATMTILKKEIGAKWTVIAIVLQLIIAYIMAFIVFNIYNLASIIGIVSTLFLSFGLLLILFAVFRTILFLKQKNKCKICGKCNF